MIPTKKLTIDGIFKLLNQIIPGRKYDWMITEIRDDLWFYTLFLSNIEQPTIRISIDKEIYTTDEDGKCVSVSINSKYTLILPLHQISPPKAMRGMIHWICSLDELHV
jgi:hypothetical protein